jgi:hypothetical protein
MEGFSLVCAGPGLPVAGASTRLSCLSGSPHFNALQSGGCQQGAGASTAGLRRACNRFSVVVNYNTKETRDKDEGTTMRTSDRILATGIAVIVGLVAGYAVASRPVAHQAITPPALDAHPIKTQARPRFGAGFP